MRDITKIKGVVEVYSKDLCTGAILHRIKKDNIITYSGPDILAKLLGGANEYVPNYMFFEFINANSPSITVPTAVRGTDKTYYSGLSAPSGYVEAPLVIGPSFSYTSNSYQNNEVTFHCQVNATAPSQAGASFTASGTTSKIIGGALVTRIDPDDVSKDLIFSRFYFATSGTGTGSIANTSNVAIGLNWTIKLL